MFISSRRKGRFGYEVELPGESLLNRRTREYYSRAVEGQALMKRKAPQADLRRTQRKATEIAYGLTLLLLIVAVQVARNLGLKSTLVHPVDVRIEVADIPPTQQFRRPPPPPRPAIPVPTEEETGPEDLTIASTERDLTDVPPPPAPPEEDELAIFMAYDEPPKIIGGMAALLKHLRYPRLAQAAGVEGMVFIKVLVGPNGEPERAEVLRAKPKNIGFEESALEAVKKVKWVPAKQRHKNIRVWVSIPVQFKLVS